MKQIYQYLYLYLYLLLYYECLDFLKKLSKVFQWPVYEKFTLGKGDRLSYYTVILCQWMQGKGLHEIIRGAIKHFEGIHTA